MSNIFDAVPIYNRKKQPLSIAGTYNAYDAYHRYINTFISIEGCLDNLSRGYQEALKVVLKEENSYYIITEDGVVMGYLVLIK